MNEKTPLFAVLATLLMVGWAAAPVAAAGSASLSVDVTQHDDGSATVTVNKTVDNQTSAVENATVVVEVLDNNTTYDGAGTYETDANGTVSLPAPNETVNVSVNASADNLTASTTAMLEPGNETNESNDTFGQRVAHFVHELQNESNVTAIGPMVANFVLENNPGSPPEHAGPPDWLFNDSENRTQGPPDHAGPPDDNESDENDSQGGPPDDAGPPDDGNESEGNESGNGPPDDRGNNDDDNEGNNDDDSDSDSPAIRVLPQD